MDYLNKLNKRGFSLIELLIVIGIFAIFASISTVVYSNYKTHENLRISANTLVEAIRYAQSSAQAGKGDSKWGVKINPYSISIFKGNDFVSRDNLYNDNYTFPSGITAIGLTEIIFEKISGVTVTAGNVTLSNSSENIILNVNEKGTITY